MAKSMDFYFNRETILKFYSTITNVDFDSITDERRAQLDNIVKKHIYYKKFHSCMMLLACFTAERINISSRNLGLLTPAEKAYFYINMIDPKLKFLEIYESANLECEIKEMCFQNFQYYDNFIIRLEIMYNKRFSEYKPDDLWARESIIRVRKQMQDKKRTN